MQARESFALTNNSQFLYILNPMNENKSAGSKLSKPEELELFMYAQVSSVIAPTRPKVARGLFLPLQ